MIKMVAIDLDGTLLDDDKNYDKKRFKTVTEKINEKNGHVVIATGNQYVKAVQFFEEMKDEIIFITDNGSTIHIEDELHYSKTLGNDEYESFIQQLPDFFKDKMVVSTHDYAIISDGEHDESFMEAAKLHYPVLERESDLDTLDVPIIKVTLKFDEDEEVDIQSIEDILPESWRLTSSGFGFYDIILDDISKLTAVRELQELYDIEDEEVAAFGDSNNDYELLEAIPNSYAMENGTDKIKNASKHVIGHSNDNAVVDTLEQLFD
jgi:hypothetical protein